MHSKIELIKRGFGIYKAFFFLLQEYSRTRQFWACKAAELINRGLNKCEDYCTGWSSRFYVPTV